MILNVRRHDKFVIIDLEIENSKFDVGFLDTEEAQQFADFLKASAEEIEEEIDRIKKR